MPAETKFPAAVERLIRRIAKIPRHVPDDHFITSARMHLRLFQKHYPGAIDLEALAAELTRRTGRSLWSGNFQLERTRRQKTRERMASGVSPHPGMSISAVSGGLPSLGKRR